jgi:vacuolar-type H+-ATPase subunit H
MGEFWTVLGLGVTTIGLLLTVAAIFLTPWGRRFFASSPSTSRSRAVAPSKDIVAEDKDADLLIGRTLMVAQKHADDLERAAQARAQEIVADAEAVANSVLQSARDEASQILQKSRDEAGAILGAAKQQATAWLTLLANEADRMVLSAYGAFREAQRSVEQTLKSFPSELERRTADWVRGSPDVTQEATVPPSNGSAPVVDPHGIAPMRSFASADGTPLTLGAHATAIPASKNGHG